DPGDLQAPPLAPRVAVPGGQAEGPRLGRHAGRVDLGPVRREGDGGDRLGAQVEGPEFLALLDVPQPDVPLPVAGEAAAAVGREGDAEDTRRVPLQAVDDPRLRRAGRGAFLRRGLLRRDGRLAWRLRARLGC